MELSPEDSFRLNVLLANNPQAIRIDESKMVVFGLSENGEAKVTLNPSGGHDRYLRLVREMLSGYITGSPGGYPVFLKRWTRMGQMRDESLEQLLLLGEPEAVVAAVCSPGITDELARRAWWIMQDAENARRMLERSAVVEGAMGSVLARFLVEFLAFETETEKMTESVRLVLQPGLLDGESRERLWKKSARKQAYLVGFLLGLPDDLPVEAKSAPNYGYLLGQLSEIAENGNPLSRLLLRISCSKGQAYVQTLRQVLKKPPTLDVVTSAFGALNDYCSSVRIEGDPDHTLAQLVEEADVWVGSSGPDYVAEVLSLAPNSVDLVRSLRILSGIGYGVVRPVVRDSTAMGSLMRKKLAPVLEPIDSMLVDLMGGIG